MDLWRSNLRNAATYVAVLALMVLAPGLAQGQDAAVTVVPSFQTGGEVLMINKDFSDGSRWTIVVELGPGQAEGFPFGDIAGVVQRPNLTDVFLSCSVPSGSQCRFWPPSDSNPNCATPQSKVSLVCEVSNGCDTGTVDCAKQSWTDLRDIPDFEIGFLEPRRPDGVAAPGSVASLGVAANNEPSVATTTGNAMHLNRKVADGAVWASAMRVFGNQEGNAVTASFTTNVFKAAGQVPDFYSCDDPLWDDGSGQLVPANMETVLSFTDANSDGPLVHWRCQRAVACDDFETCKRDGWVDLPERQVLRAKFFLPPGGWYVDGLFPCVSADGTWCDNTFVPGGNSAGDRRASAQMKLDRRASLPEGACVSNDLGPVGAPCNAEVENCKIVNIFRELPPLTVVPNCNPEVSECDGDGNVFIGSRDEEERPVRFFARGVFYENANGDCRCEIPIEEAIERDESCIDCEKAMAGKTCNLFGEGSSTGICLPGQGSENQPYCVPLRPSTLVDSCQADSDCGLAQCCADDIRDGCDPAAGDANCAGVCVASTEAGLCGDFAAGALCNNGVVDTEAGEQCDGLAPPPSDGCSVCTRNCQLDRSSCEAFSCAEEPDGVICEDDGDDVTLDVCSRGVCTHEPPEASSVDERGAATASTAPLTKTHDLQAGAGTITFVADDGGALADRFEVLYGGEVIFDTGCKCPTSQLTGSESAQKSPPLAYGGAGTKIQVRVTPNCDPRCAGTSGWKYRIVPTS